MPAGRGGLYPACQKISKRILRGNAIITNALSNRRLKTDGISPSSTAATEVSRMGLKILSCGAGMQSTALALMSCENALYGIKYEYSGDNDCPVCASIMPPEYCPHCGEGLSKGL